jgi:hypothetical protein
VFFASGAYYALGQGGTRSNSLMLGRVCGTIGGNFDSLIDDVWIYERVLTEEEVW